MMRKTLSSLLLAWCCACGPRDIIHGRVLDAATGLPLENVILAVETGGLYIDNPDKTKGNQVTPMARANCRAACRALCTRDFAAESFSCGTPRA